MENFALEIDAAGIAAVTFDMPGRSMNTISHSVQDDLGTLAATIRDDQRIVGAILRSGKDSGFCAGADLGELRDDIDRWAAAASQDELRAALAEASHFSRRIRDLETTGKPLVAVINGVALGGGLELALGCHHRIAIDDGKLRLGLPEATLGLMPGAGGTQRLLRLAGLMETLPYLLDGGPIELAEALRLRLVHESVEAAQAMDRARQWILESADAIAPWDVKGFRLPGGGPHTSAAYALFGPAIAARRGMETPGDADGNILKTVYEGAQVPIDAGLRIESRYFLNTLRTPSAAERVSGFLSRKSKAPAG
ncbi:Enoyl-CoA hydratase/carnithine racemase [Sphingobium faniae]|nr:Enoyl-CoA hydratase/carnithine racemase [Sphingobium faniae]